MKNPGIILRATPRDADAVARIGRETFYETWRPVNTEEDMQQYIAKAFNPEKIKEDLADDNNTFLLYTHDDLVVGYAKMRRDRTCEVFGREKVIEIERIYVSSHHQGMKFGKMLMDECIEIANREGNAWLWLGVNIDNTKAIDFYRRYGFEIFGTKQFRLGDAVDDDYLMRLKLNAGSPAHSD
jgi:diamine N-acetyltransferase